MLPTTLRISGIINAEVVRLATKSLNVVLVGLNHGAALGYLALIQRFASFHRLGVCFFANGFFPLSSWISNRFLGCGRTTSDGKWRMPVLTRIGGADMQESLSWIELTFVSALHKFVNTLGCHPLLEMPLCIVSGNSEQASQMITAAIPLEDHIGFWSVHFRAYKGHKGITPCTVGTPEQESLIVFLAKAEQVGFVGRPRLTRRHRG